MSELVNIPGRTGKRLRCNCGYAWVYLGKSEIYASCPKCRSTVTIQPKQKRRSGDIR